jgi:hypothetical protein
MMLAQVFKPRTKGWRKARAAITDYIHEQEGRQRQALAGRGAHAGAARGEHQAGHAGKLEASE